jgi:hypothetical protein
MLDEPTLVTILTAHFRTASQAEIHDAAQDVILLDLLDSKDMGIPWDDRRQALTGFTPVTGFQRRQES